MNSKKKIVWWIKFSIFLNQIKCDSYDENLLIRPLSDKTVLTKFTFSFKDKVGSPGQHTRRYPRILDEITRNLGVDELELQLTRGWTDFGVPLDIDVPNGAYLLATFDDEERVTEKWKTLVGQLAGLFCISLNQLSHQVSFSPVWKLPSYQPLENTERRRVGFLPREVACTENLTPWKKILPTGGKRGLGMFLTNPHHQLEKSTIWSIGLKFDNKNVKSLDLTHTMIVDVSEGSDNGLMLKLHENITKIDEMSGTVNLTPRRLFGVSEADLSPIVSESKANFLLCETEDLNLITNNFDKMELFLNPQMDSDDFGRPCQNFEFNLKDKKEFHFSIGVQFPITHSSTTLVPFAYVMRFNGGPGLDGKSKIVSRIYNKFGTKKTIMSLEMIPWWLNPKISNMIVDGCELVTQYYTPAKDKQRVTGSLLLQLNVSPLSTCSIIYDYETRWPKWNEYPADANYGRFLPSQIIFYEMYGEPHKSFSAPILIYIPIPDFSMPFNVLCLVCTVFAMSIGGIHNLTTSVLVYSNVEKPDTNLGKLLYFLKASISTLVEKLKTKGGDNSSHEEQILSDEEKANRQASDELEKLVDNSNNSDKAQIADSSEGDPTLDLSTSAADETKNNEIDKNMPFNSNPTPDESDYSELLNSIKGPVEREKEILDLNSGGSSTNPESIDK